MAEWFFIMLGVAALPFGVWMIAYSEAVRFDETESIGFFPFLAGISLLVFFSVLVLTK